MPTRKAPRKGSLQYWPRKRAQKFLPRVNWSAINSGKNLKGFIGYKAGMVSVEIQDNTLNSLTKDKKIIIPATVIECPPIKIFSVRFYKDNKVSKEVLNENLDKDLKKKVKLPKKTSKLDDIKTEDYDDVSVIVYSQVKKTGLKKKPDMIEVGLTGNEDEKIKFVRENLGKEFAISDFFENGQNVDIRGLTKGKGFSGPVKRFGITLKQSKSEKGRRRPGSIGPWHPARVTFRVPMAGQLGMFTRVHYNSKIIEMNKGSDKPIKGIKNYGDVKTDYLIVEGSVQGSAKRQVLITAPLRESKKSRSKNYEFVEIKK